MSYILICSPSGSGCREALQKLQEKFGTDEVKIADIETELCNRFETKEKLKQAGVTSDSPSILDITWNLSRSTIAQLWQNAARQCISDIAASPAKTKIVCCNLIYYGGRRKEYYSIINPQVFSINNGQIKPSFVGVFIDDVYDMYIRLTGEHEIYALKPWTLMYYRRLESEEDVSIREMGLQEASIYYLESQLDVMARLLDWRNQEIVLAENLAVQFQAKFMAWGVKQLYEVISSWITQSNSITVYLSHPISRPRDKRRIQGNWPEVVSQFNSLQKEFLERGLLCVMPTAIDEYRINRLDKKRFPFLEERWPLPDGGDSLYQLPQGTKDMNHEQLISYKNWDFEKQEASPVDKTDTDEQTNMLLRIFEKNIERQISSRDHLWVSHTDGLLVYRPFIWSGNWSRGVDAEVRHWEYLAKAEDTRRAAFIHFEEDIIAWRENYRENLDSELDSAMDHIIAEKNSLSLAKAKEVREWIKQGKSGILDTGSLPGFDIQQVSEELPVIRREAKINLLRSILTSVGSIESSQVGLWICENMEELQANYDGIGEFFTIGKVPSESWHSKIDMILPDGT